VSGNTSAAAKWWGLVCLRAPWGQVRYPWEQARRLPAILQIQQQQQTQYPLLRGAQGEGAGNGSMCGTSLGTGPLARSPFLRP
jgi:hypothetical protein